MNPLVITVIAELSDGRDRISCSKMIFSFESNLAKKCEILVSCDGFVSVTIE